MALLLAFTAPASFAIGIEAMTFSMPADSDFIAKRLTNDNQTARLYQIAIYALDKPGDQEQLSRPAEGELLYAPKQLTLSPGQSDIFKFFWHGPEDDRERYYRVLFREQPTQMRSGALAQGGAINMAPTVVLQTILVVRPRKTRFDWQWAAGSQRLRNSGNTWFKLLLKADCDSDDAQAVSFYLRPGEQIQHALLRGKGQKVIVYDGRFIPLDNACVE